MHRSLLTLTHAGAQSGLPLGTNSSFLSAAVKGSVAPSTAWGLWPGSRSLDPVDGLLVVGGYDASRVNGNFTTFPIGQWSLTQACPFQVNVTGLSYSGISLLGNGTQNMIACVEPSVQHIELPPTLAQAFGNATNQNTSFYNGMTYPSSAGPNGTLSITLSNNYTTTITNSELFTLERGSDQYGRYSIVNTSVVEAGVADTRTSNPDTVTPTLGGLFLTFNYLLVDYEKGQFQLAPAIPASQSETLQLKTICTPTPTPRPSPNATKPTPSPTPTPTSKPSHKGAIVGGTVGVVAGLALIAGLLFLLLRRRRQQPRTANTNSANSGHTVPTPVSKVMSWELPSPVSVENPPHSHLFSSQAQLTGLTLPRAYSLSKCMKCLQA